MKKIYGLVLVFSLFLACLSGLALQVADANFIGLYQGLPSIIIQSDGSVSPQTEYIKRDGNVYSLTADLQQKYVISINCSNIVFDGQGHIINGSGMIFWANLWHGYHSRGIAMENAVNVVIKDVTILGFTEFEGIYVNNCSNISILNVQSDKPLYLVSGGNNTVVKSRTSLVLLDILHSTVYGNNLSSLGIAESEKNLIYGNNISRASIDDGLINFWDNGSVGNYWTDYLSRYPDASEIGGTGIADVPYVIDGDNIDGYPFMQPVTITEEPEPPVQESEETGRRPIQDSREAEFFLFVLAGVVSTVLIAVVIAVLAYRKRHSSFNYGTSVFK